MMKLGHSPKPEPAMPTIDHPPLQLQVRAGQALTIELESFPGAGAIWQAPATPAGCHLTAADSVASSPGVGGPARQRFVLSCDKAGERQLRFELKRPWESEVQAVQAVLVTIT